MPLPLKSVFSALSRAAVSRYAARYRDVVFFGPSDRRAIAMTIDDGPDPKTTPRILDTLERLGVEATFFLIGERVAAYPDIAHEIADRGHEIGHHLWQDRKTATLERGELEDAIARTSAALRPIADVRWLRPGGGWVNADIIEVATNEGFDVVVGDVFPFDTRVPSAAIVSYLTLLAARQGSIITIHDHGDRGERAVIVLDKVARGFSDRGFAIVTLSELVRPSGGSSDAHAAAIDTDQRSATTD